MSTAKVIAAVIVSTLDSGKLSLRSDVHDPSASPLKRALKDAGFEPGDLVEITWVGHDTRLSQEEE